MSKEIKKLFDKKLKKGKGHVYYQVGIAKVDDRPLRYSDLPTSDTGWVTDLRFRPYNFDLVFLRVKEKDRPVSAWWASKHWEGRLFKGEYTVTAWKRNSEYD